MGDWYNVQCSFLGACMCTERPVTLYHSDCGMRW